MPRYMHKCIDYFGQEKCRVESPINCFVVWSLNWRNHFEEKRKKFSPSVPWTGLLREPLEGADSSWAVGICHVLTALSLPDHFTQVTNHLVLTTSDHTNLSKIWTDDPEGLFSDSLQIEDWIKTKQKHGLKYEGIDRKSRAALMVVSSP